MNRRDLIIGGMGIVLLGAGFAGGALFHSLRHRHDLTIVQPTAVVPAQPAAPLLAAATAPEPAAPPLPTPAAQPSPDKTRTEAVLPAVGSKSDGKDVVSGKDGKEVLSPISEMINPQPRNGSLDPGAGTAVVEHRNNSNKLLDPPSQQNVGGPVVSPETR